MGCYWAQGHCIRRKNTPTCISTSKSGAYRRLLVKSALGLRSDREVSEAADIFVFDLAITHGTELSILTQRNIEEIINSPP